MKLSLVTVLAVPFCLYSASLAYPHGGGLDSYGCHHNRKQGGYHCHRGQLAGQSFGSKDEMLRQLGGKSQSKPADKPVSKDKSK